MERKDIETQTIEATKEGPVCFLQSELLVILNPLIELQHFFSSYWSQESITLHQDLQKDCETFDRYIAKLKELQTQFINCQTMIEKWQKDLQNSFYIIEKELKNVQFQYDKACSYYDSPMQELKSTLSSYHKDINITIGNVSEAKNSMYHSEKNINDKIQKYEKFSWQILDNIRTKYQIDPPKKKNASTDPI